jgi:hypothetical protein
MVYGKAYIPGLAEMMAVESLQRNGAPKNVEFIEVQGVVASGYTDRIIRFTAPDGKQYEAEARLLVAQPWGPYTSWVEMDSLGMIEHKPPQMQ